jgi:hypothetical protein
MSTKLYDLIGTVTKTGPTHFGSDRNITIQTVKKNEYTVSFDKKLFNNFQEDDLIICKVSRINNTYQCNIQPLIVLSVDRDKIERRFYKALAGTGFGVALSKTLYTNLARLASEHGYTLDQQNEKKTAIVMTEEVVGTDGVILYMSSLTEGDRKFSSDILMKECKLSEKQSYKLLNWWYKNRLVRRLHLFGLNNKQIRACRLTHDEIYQMLITNPFKLAPIPIDKCLSVLNLLKHPVIQEQKRCGEILRKVYDFSENMAWVCVPIKTMEYYFRDFFSHYNMLYEEYGLELDSKMVYMKYNLEVERSMVTLFDNLIVKTAQAHAIQFEAPLSEIKYSIDTYTEEQKDAIKGVLNSKVSIITGGGGTGKCLSPETKIVMFNGILKRIADVKVGELVMGDDSTYRIVLGTTSGIAPMYKINPLKGQPFTCNAPHILTLKGKSANIFIKVIDCITVYFVYYTVYGYSQFKMFSSMKQANDFLNSLDNRIGIFDISLEDLMMRPSYLLDNLNLIHKPVDFPVQLVTIDPYKLGFYLGNTYASKYPHFQEQVEQELNLDTQHLDFKSIPDVYKYNVIEVRIKLLSGLVDNYGIFTDFENCYFPDKIGIDFQDLKYLCESLGFITEFQPNKLSIYGHNLSEIIQCRELPYFYYNQSKFSITQSSSNNYFGFELSGNGRFFLEDFTITHNSTICKDICNNYELRNIRVEACAFTGKAVSRLNKTIGKGKAKTMDFMIKRSAIIGKFDGLIIDESSMVTTELMYRFKQAFPHEFFIILMGDCNQLPPISWGFLMKQIIASERVPIYTLTKNQRIIEHVVDDDDKNNQPENIEPASIVFDRTILDNCDTLIDKSRDLSVPMVFKESSGFYQLDGGINDMRVILLLIKDAYSLEDIVCISPYNEYIPTINKIFQDVFLSEAEENVDAKGVKWKVGDRIMMLKNNYEIGVMNGEEGEVTALVPEGVVVKFGKEIKEYVFKYFSTDNPSDNVEKLYAMGEEEDNSKDLTIELIQQSFCISVHKSQGSEYKVVILFIPDKLSKGKLSSFLNINLLYTSITRTKQVIWIVTKPNILGIISMNKLPSRVENLAGRLHLLRNDELESVLSEFCKVKERKIAETSFEQCDELDLFDDWDY